MSSVASTEKTLRPDHCSEGLLDLRNTQSMAEEHTGPVPRDARWTWSCRAVEASTDWKVDRTESDQAPKAGDLVCVRVKDVGNHTRIMLASNEKVRLYEGDLLIGVFGNRYATDAFEGEVTGTKELHILSNAGMIGTVHTKNANSKSPTVLEFQGMVVDEAGRRLNLTDLLFEPKLPRQKTKNVILAVGTGMNSGKTTSVARMVKQLSRSGVRVAGCKVTGSVCSNDLLELQSTAILFSRDFSDYGFPSTYKSDPEQLKDLFLAMVADAQQVDPDVIIMEVADGILQQETSMLLSDELVAEYVAGVIVTAPCALSALEGTRQVQSKGHVVAAVTGIITNSPLFQREFEEHSEIPICTSSGQTLSDQVMGLLRN